MKRLTAVAAAVLFLSSACCCFAFPIRWQGPITTQVQDPPPAMVLGP